MDNNNTKQITPAIDETIQSQVRQDIWPGIDVMPLLVRAGQVIAPHWSTRRDYELSRFWLNNDHVSSAFSMFVTKAASIPIKIIPRDMSIKSHNREAEYLNAVLIDGADFGKGWHASLMPRMILSYLSQDNGTFSEVIGDGPKDKQREGLPLGFAFLDPQRCQRTSNPEYPVIYNDVSGERFKLHHSRVMYSSSMPSNNIRLNGVGFCSLSRMINTAQHLTDLATTEQEELGSRPKRRILIGKKGITAQEIATAFNEVDIQMDNQGLSRYSKSVVLAPKIKPPSDYQLELDVKDLTTAISGDDKEKSITLGMFLIALALDIPPRWLWPATSTGATKADAMFQHVAGLGGGIGHLLEVFISMLGGGKLADVLKKPIPSKFEVVFDFQDDEQDRQRSEIQELRTKVWTANLTNGLIDERIMREQALDAGDITEQQFQDLELASGRLEDGTSVLNLFMTSDRELQEMLSLSVGDVLNVKANDTEFVLGQIDDKIIQLRVLLANPPRPKIFDKVKMAMAALEALKALYIGNQADEDMPQQSPNTRVSLSPMQIQAAISVVQNVQSGQISRQAALSALEVMFGLSTEDANRLLADLGESPDNTTETANMTSDTSSNSETVIQQ